MHLVVKPGKPRRRRPDELPATIQVRETRPGEGKAFTDLAALAMEGHGDFDDREAMSAKPSTKAARSPAGSEPAGCR
ncbi:hypothetical protein ACFUNF_33345 [Streptomyces sp. NPDC057291]|uniref:hypothetical protein n=1 Tax=Streptomyces sp. NPDC057291 TaxID=3346087 RepID=UPI00363E51A1